MCFYGTKFSLFLVSTEKKSIKRKNRKKRAIFFVSLHLYTLNIKQRPI